HAGGRTACRCDDLAGERRLRGGACRDLHRLVDALWRILVRRSSNKKHSLAGSLECCPRRRRLGRLHYNPVHKLTDRNPPTESYGAERKGFVQADEGPRTDWQLTRCCC